MSVRLVILAVLVAPAALRAQQPSDSVRPARDSVSPIELKDITVTAAPARRQAPLGSVTVPASVIRQAPAINTVDLLRQTAGVEAHDQGQGPGFASDLAIRGFSSDHSTDMALWIDGVPINEPVNGHAEGYNDWSLLMPQAVQQIDIYKGPTSALYGNFSLAGTVNVRTLERMRGTDVSVDGGSYGRLEGAALSGFDHDHTGAVFGLRGVRDGGWRPNSKWDLGQAHARIVHDLSPTVSLDAGTELYAAGWDSPGFLTLAQFRARQYDSIANNSDDGHKYHAQERVSLRVLSGSSLVWRSTLYSTQGRWQLFLTTPPEGGETEGSGSQLEEDDHRYGFGATSAVTWELPGRAELTVGGEGRWDHSHYENYFTTNRARDSVNADKVPVVARQVSGAGFVESRIPLGARLVATLGGRYEIQDTRDATAGGTAQASKGVFGPKFGALVRLSHAAVVYGNVSRGYRRTDGVIEDPTLPFITAWAYETGVKFDRAGVHASAAAFQMDVSNEQTFDPISATSTSGGKSRRKGLEFGLGTNLGPAVTLTGDFTYVDAKYRRLITEDGDTLSGQRVFNTAKFVGSAVVALAPPTAIWSLRVSSNLVGPYTPFDEPGVELGTYALVHLSGGLRIGSALFNVGARNLFNRAYPELRAGGFVSPGQPRSVYGSVRYLLF
jgi:outer membrane receptor protein involved in Fe transport